MKKSVVYVIALSFFAALAQAKDATDAIEREASDAFLARDYDKAIDLYSKVLAARPKDFMSYSSRGLAYREKKEYAKALADLNRAIELKPLGMFYFNRGTTHDLNGNDKSAIADFTRALKDEPADKRIRAECYVQRAHCYIDEEKTEPALADLNAAIKADGKSAEAYFLRGIVHKVVHAYDKSVADYEKAIALAPEDPAAYAGEAYLLSVCPAPKYRDGAKAVRYATKACELTKWQDAHKLDSLATAYAETGDFDNAIQFQKRADEISKQPDAARLTLYEQHQPVRDLNRSENAVPLPTHGTVAIKFGEKLTAHFDIDGEHLINPKTAKGSHLGKDSIALDFRPTKGQRFLFLQHSFAKIVRVRCLARLKGWDAYFETDLLPVPPDVTNPEAWSEPIEELVLFDFHFTEIDPQHRGISQL